MLRVFMGLYKTTEFTLIAWDNNESYGKEISYTEFLIMALFWFKKKRSQEATDH